MDAYLNEIAQLDDIGSARAYARQRNVAVSKCKDLQDILDRLRYDWMKRNGQMKDLKVVS